MPNYSGISFGNSLRGRTLCTTDRKSDWSFGAPICSVSVMKDGTDRKILEAGSLTYSSLQSERIRLFVDSIINGPVGQDIAKREGKEGVLC